MRPVVTLAMGGDELATRLLDPPTRERLSSVADVDFHVIDEFESADARERLARTTVLLTGWDCPIVDGDVLDGAPGLRAIVHAAGTVKDHLDPVCWDRGIAVSTAADANAIPVAEFTLAAILLAGKRVLDAERDYRATRADVDLLGRYGDIGNYRTVVGLVGASRIGRRVAELLRPFDVEVAIADPYLTDEEAEALGAHRRELHELAASSRILSLHAPLLPETVGMIDAEVLAAMPDGATLINTARGQLVESDALIAELVSGRLHAILDVTDPEPLHSDSPLFDLPNVMLTPHIAGAAGLELARLGSWAVDEILRFLRGEPFRSPVTRAQLDRMA